MFEKIVLVTRKTRLEGLIERYNTRDQARFYIQSRGGDFEFYVREHATYQQSLSKLQKNLRTLAKLHVIERNFLTNYLFTEKDLVVTIGIDGLVVNTAKYLDGQPLVAVNPDPSQIDGTLLPFDVSQAAGVVKKALQGRMQIKKVTMAEARLKDGQSLLAFNDIFIGVENHVSARYRIQIDGKVEEHSSSGIIVSTGAGSTGWMSSFFNMANGMLAAYEPEGEIRLKKPEIAWDCDHLYYIVREPFISKTSGAKVVSGRINRGKPLVVESHMSTGGVIFSDGVASDHLEFNAGEIATVGLAKRQTQLVVG